MSKSYYSLGLMSGTSMEGVDASIIQSDGETEYKVILDKYFEYDQDIYENIHNLKDKINNSKDLKNLSESVKSLEKEITLFHAKSVNKIAKNFKGNIDFVGFHGQTIFHNSREKISKQLGDGNLLSKLIKNTVIYNFRENDLKHGGQGAPLVPIFHKLLINQHKINLPVCILNLGGIANVTVVDTDYKIVSYDIGPGNCLIDEWIRKNSEKKYDNKGLIAQAGKRNEKIFSQAVKNFENRKEKIKSSLDIKDFNSSFVNELSLEDGAATLIEFTVRILSESFLSLLEKISGKLQKIVVCGGGRKNNFLMKRLKKKVYKNLTLQPIDDFGIDGDFVESQAFAYLAIRSYLKLPISFPETTGVNKPCTGGIIVKN